MANCIFCNIAQGKAEAAIVYENDSTIAFFDINPANEYHTLVIPKEHFTNLFDIPESELVEITKTIKHITNLYQEKLGMENVQVVNSSGAEAQQEVMHLHFHIVPRYKGDNQDINWSHKTELREQFDELLQKLK